LVIVRPPLNNPEPFLSTSSPVLVWGRFPIDLSPPELSAAAFFILFDSLSPVRFPGRYSPVHGRFGHAPPTLCAASSYGFRREAYSCFSQLFLRVCPGLAFSTFLMSRTTCMGSSHPFFNPQALPRSAFFHPSLLPDPPPQDLFHGRPHFTGPCYAGPGHAAVCPSFTPRRCPCPSFCQLFGGDSFVVPALFFRLRSSFSRQQGLIVCSSHPFPGGNFNAFFIFDFPSSLLFPHRFFFLVGGSSLKPPMNQSIPSFFAPRSRRFGSLCLSAYAAIPCKLL